MGNKKSTNILLTIMGILIILVLVARIATFDYITVAAVLQIITLVFVSLYGFWLYKRPHGNMLKYAMLLFAVSNILIAFNYYDTAGSYGAIVRVLACTAVCYGAGRLNRIDQNRFLFPIIGIVFLGLSIYGLIFKINHSETNVFKLINVFNFTITYLTLMIAYFARYEEHKLAGLMDAPKK